MLFQRMGTQRRHSRRALALLALAIAALIALNPNTGRGEGLADLPLLITSDTEGAITYHPAGKPAWDRVAFNVEEGQEVTYKLALTDKTPPADAKDLHLSVWCWCNWNADIISVTTAAGTDREVVHDHSNRGDQLYQYFSPDSFPITMTVRGQRVSRREYVTSTDTSTDTRAAGSHLSVAVYWRKPGTPSGNRWTGSRVSGRIIVSERSHPADEAAIQYVTFDDASEVMKGGVLRYTARLTDKDGNAVTAAQNIVLVVNSRPDYGSGFGDPSTPLRNALVTIPTGASSAEITVQSRTDIATRPIEYVYIQSYFRDHPSGVKFANQFWERDASGRIVDGTEFTLSSFGYGGIEGSNMPIVFDVDGRVNVGEFVLRLKLFFNMLRPSPMNRASAADFVGGHSHYDCRITPTRTGRHVLRVPILEDHVADDLEAFHLQLALVSAPDGARGFADADHPDGLKFAYGMLRDRARATISSSSRPPTTDCVAVGDSSALPSSAQRSQPLQSPISLSTDTITLSEGSSFSYDVTLNSDPGDQTVTVQPVSLDEVMISTSASLSFTSANWNQPQAVVVTAETDADDDDEQAGIGHVVKGISDTDVSPVGPVIIAMVTEQPTLGLDLRQPTQRSFGDQPFFAYWIRLDRQPSSDVEIELTQASDSAVVQLHTNSLGFTTTNWNRYQIVVLKPLDSTVGSELKVTHSASTHSINSGESVSATISGG